MAPFELVNEDGEYEGPTGHEQTPIAIVNWLLLAVSIVYFAVIYRKQTSDQLCYEDWSWYVTNGVQTFFCVALGMMGAYPGYAVFRYTAGLGNDGPGSRLESFYINSTMGMVLGVPLMAMVDHFMFVFSWFVMLFCWMPWPQVQVATSGLACVCGLYMGLWIPTNIASNKKDPGPFVLCGAFTICSFVRILSGTIGFHGNAKTILLSFNCIVFVLVILVSINGVRRSDRAKHSIALTNQICQDLGEGPVWAVWPKGKYFPSGWWFEPPPFGSTSGWPYGPWPTGPNSAQPPQELIDAAAEEMKREIPEFLSLWLVLGVIFGLIAAFFVAIAFFSDASC